MIKYDENTKIINLDEMLSLKEIEEMDSLAKDDSYNLGNILTEEELSEMESKGIIEIDYSEEASE